MRRFLAALVLLVAVPSAPRLAQVSDLTPVQTFEPGTKCRADDVVCRDWLRFRRFVVGPYQALAIAAHQGRATVILSEPPSPRAELLRLVAATFKSDLTAYSYRRWPTGLDGWLEDLVLDVRLRDARLTAVRSGHDLSAWQAPASLVDRLRFLHAALHGTVDAFWVDDVNAFRERNSAPSIPELPVLAGDLLGWMSDPALGWTDVTGSAASVPFNTIADPRRPAVYQSSNNALIALAVPGKASLASLEVPFRRFTVASDLLLGATQVKSGTTWIIGRARQLPFTTLPPLRFETLASFVRDRTTELMQSYERRRVFAGRVRTGPFAGWDWAPILLSRQLDDSEFGTLLNHADQILKSWSEAGTIDYYAFVHPRPGRFPFEPERASEYFARRLSTTSLVFNWNTQAFSTIYQTGKRELLTVDRLGALPILYLPSGNRDNSAAGRRTGAQGLRIGGQSRTEALSRDAAVAARRIFAGLGDPILVRVAQNTLLHQVAQAFLGSVVAPAADARPSRFDVVSRVLRTEAERWLRAVAEPGPMPGMTRDAEFVVERAIRNSNLTITQLAEALATPQVAWTRLAGLAAKLQQQQKRQAELRTQYLAAYNTYSIAFRDFCKAVGGTLRPANRRQDGHDTSEICDYQKTRFASATPAEQRLDDVKAVVDSLAAEMSAIDATLDPGMEEFDRLSRIAEEAAVVADAISGRVAVNAELDQILARVRAAVAADPHGSIRTPALVLSRNTEDEDAIGGHNITFDPVRTRVPPRAIAPGVDLPRTTPPASATEALRVTRSGSLLDELRPAARTPVSADVMTQLARDAADCACAVIRRTTENEYLFARNGRPPVQRRLSSSADIPDALTGPPPATTVRFDGLSESPGLLEAIVRSTELAMETAPRQTTRLQRFTEAAARIFRGDAESAGPSTLFSYLRPGRPPAVLRVSGVPPEAAGAFLNRTVSWRNATVRQGTVRMHESGSTTTTYVTFRGPAGGRGGGRSGGGTGGPSGGSAGSGGRRGSGRGGGRAEEGPLTPIGVEAQRSRGQSAVDPANLAEVARRGLIGADAGSGTMSDALLLLRETIERQLDDTEIHFFLESSPATRISRRLAPQPVGHID